MTPAGAADGRGLALSGLASPPLSEDLAARLAAARAALGAGRALDAATARVRLGDGFDGAAGSGCALDRALGGGLAREGLHEIAPRGAPDRASAFGFALALAARLAQGRAILWVGDEATFAETGLPYAPGLDRHGLPSRRVIAARARHAREGPWALGEAAKSGAAGRGPGGSRPPRGRNALPAAAVGAGGTGRRAVERGHDAVRDRRRALAPGGVDGAAAAARPALLGGAARQAARRRGGRF